LNDWSDTRADVPLRGGPYDGGQIEAGLFGGRHPNFVVRAGGRHAHYVTDVDADGLYYRFSGWQTRTATEADAAIRRLSADRAREAAHAIAGEARAQTFAARALSARLANQRQEAWSLIQAARGRLAAAEARLENAYSRPDGE
jgi:hypothetical protein